MSYIDLSAEELQRLISLFPPTLDLEDRTLCNKLTLILERDKEKK
ncbi:hypothetical protein [Paenibacillus sp. An7]|nr:hypothetical protein [Paenibacillus sp. An7]